MIIEVIDLGINNLASMSRALRESFGVMPRVVSDSSGSKAADLLVIPGTGAFGKAAWEIDQRGFRTVVQDRRNEGVPILGVCLGMQLLAVSSDESPGAVGFGLVRGHSRRLRATAGSRVPHVGWSVASGVSMGNESNTDFFVARDYYFSHSFVLEPEEPLEVLTTPHGEGSFVSGFTLAGRIFGAQFHPEKSSHSGIDFLRSALGWSF